jgi:hypothetical protein
MPQTKEVENLRKALADSDKMVRCQATVIERLSEKVKALEGLNGAVIAKEVIAEEAALHNGRRALIAKAEEVIAKEAALHNERQALIAEIAKLRARGFADCPRAAEIVTKLRELAPAKQASESRKPKPLRPAYVYLDWRGYRVTVAYLILDGGLMRYAAAWCCPDDNFSKRKGRALALARLYDCDRIAYRKLNRNRAFAIEILRGLEHEIRALIHYGSWGSRLTVPENVVKRTEP